MGRWVQGATDAANLANDEHAHQPLAGVRQIRIQERVLSSAGQRGLRCEFATPTINVHAGRITKISSGNEKTRRGWEAASRIKTKIREKLDKCFKSAELLLLMMMMKKNVLVNIMIHLHYSTVNDGVKWLLWSKYGRN